ncbi:hypothetical protein GCM10023144_35760 [Pigmentiphaga soli]|uniref:DUF802 domain-containing protein n=2 Tax=Pigmentiphaga soli TaxID=1007095 RepID=A0ABP8HF73_9BURK
MAGLAVAGWIAAGYAGGHLLALCVTLLIVAFYLAGALELYRYRQATAALCDALAGLSEPPAGLGAWLERLPAGLRNAVRLRIEGERAALPGPGLTPYLVGLLVLLGMLGTFLGMVATLRGTGLALESATDLQAIRASLAAPVEGLGFAFGTSIAGVATSAMLGLLSALCRRDRLRAAQALDARIATTLRVFSPAHRRDEMFRLLQRQAETMPALVDRLEAMAAAMAQQGQALNERLAAGQEAFHGKAGAAYEQLADSVRQSLQESVTTSVTASARAAGEAIRPAVEAAMAGIARETAALHQTVTQAVGQQLDGVTQRLETATATVATTWTDALAEHRRAGDALSAGLRESLDGFAGTFERRSADLVENVSARLEAAAGRLSQSWRDALAQHERSGEKLAHDNRQALAAAAEAFERHAASLVGTIGGSHAELQAALAAADRQRLEQWAGTLDTMAAGLRREWEQTGAAAAGRQQEICDTLARTAQEVSARTQEQASLTIAEIGQLVQAASEAPRAAAEVVAELRQKLSDSMARDNAMLEERSRLLDTLGTLLDAVNHASTEQRQAVDALVSGSAELLDRVGARFAERLETETDRLATAAAEATGGAVEIASLGDAFGAAVQQFGQSSDKLTEHLQRIESALEKSMARSDEQLAYYVAQAREAIDLSVLSQKQIIENLQQLAGQAQAAGPEAA